MTIQELKALILADSQAKAFADAGNDTAAAQRATAIATAEVSPLFATYRTVMGLVSLKAAGQLSLSLAAMISNGPVEGLLDASDIQGLVKADQFLSGEMGLDIGNAQTRGLLDAMVAMGLPLTAENAAAIKAVAEVRPTISPSQVSEAWAEYRPDGKVVV